MKRLTHALLLLPALLLGGCRAPTAADPAVDTVPLLAPAAEEQALENAGALLRARSTREALTAFMALNAESEDPAMRTRALLGAAQALRAEGNTAGALALLTPLPSAAVSAWEARRCALAGELRLRLDDPVRARSALRQALDCGEDPAGAWRPAASFNLGKCALALGQPDEARAAFSGAREAFLARGDRRGAEACDAVLADLEVLNARKER